MDNFAEYTRALIAELALQAAARKHITLAYILKMAAEEASQLSASPTDTPPKLTKRPPPDNPASSHMVR